ncbi:MAG: serine protease [Bacteroidales bacterium]|nr:serine protease [Bacteroidales bacterium]MCF8390186.1 serine protease [Bacteroidales bacterium]
MEKSLSDMFEEIWNKYHKAVCSIIFYSHSGSKLFGITGFKYGNRVITDNVVAKLKEVNEVAIRFYEIDGMTVFREIRYSTKDFVGLLAKETELNNIGFTFFLLSEDQQIGLQNLEFCSNCEPVIGLQVLTIEYQFDYNNIALRPGFITSYSKNGNGYTMIQYDGSINPSVNGAPLIDVKTGKVKGILSNRDLHIVKAYEEMKRIADNNIETLEQVKGKWTFDDIDPIQVMIVSQNQLKYAAKKFYTSFSLKSGCALEINYLKDLFDMDREPDFE